MILQFNQIDKDDLLLAGGKGANLGELVAAGINVPQGFVLTANAYKRFIKENNIDTVIADKIVTAGTEQEQLLTLAAELRTKIKKGKFPASIKSLIQENYAQLGDNKSVAVRSSATAEDLADASFAGQQETYLNVQGIEEVLQQIQNCYASLWTDRAVLYRLQQRYDQSNLAIAVVIQEMVESEKSGVLFTANPITNNQQQMLIDANYGLGESVVSGSVTADNYIIDKSGKIVSVTIGSKETQIVYDHKQTKAIAVEASKRKERVLSDQELMELHKIGQKIENHYGHPLDIEWAIHQQKLYILQARAITTLKTTANAKAEEIQAYVKDIKIKKYNRKLMSFMVEKIPFAFRAIEYDYFVAVSGQKNTIFAENGINLSPNLVMDDRGIMTIQREKVSLNSNIYKIFGTIHKLYDYQYCNEQGKKYIKKYSKQLTDLGTINFDAMNLAMCKDFIIKVYDLIKKTSYDRFIYAVFPALIDKSLTKVLQQVNPNYTAFDLYWGLNNRTSELEKDIANMATYVNKQKELKLAILANNNYAKICQDFTDFKELSDEFLAKNGYKTDTLSYCVEGKTFLEDPDRILQILKPLLSDEKVQAFNNESKDFEEIKRALQQIYGKKYPQLEKKIDCFRYFHYVREEGQYYFEIASYYARKCLKRVNQLLLGNDNYKLGVANLFHDELITVLEAGQINADFLERIKIRNENLALANQVWEASKLVLYDNKGDVLSGISGNSGVVIAKVCIVKDSEEFHKLQKGEVLVCPFTAPEWTPLFKVASAVVADTGSALSHAAIVAREFGIPAVLGVGFATTRFKDGDMIKVDGDKGEVTFYKNE